MTDESDVARARTRAKIAKAQMLGTFDALKERTHPKNLASEAVEKASSFAARRPITVAAAVGTVALLLIVKTARRRSKRAATATDRKRST